MTDAKASASGLPYAIKRTWEQVTYDFDFTPVLRAGETLTALDSIAASPAGLTIDGEALSTPFAQARISAGTAGTDYTVVARATTSSGDKRQVEGQVRVREP